MNIKNDYVYNPVDRDYNTYFLFKAKSSSCEILDQTTNNDTTYERPSSQ